MDLDVLEVELTGLDCGLDVGHETNRQIEDPSFRLEQSYLTLYFTGILSLPPLFLSSFTPEPSQECSYPQVNS